MKNLGNFGLRVRKKVSFHAHRLAGTDNISGLRISPRNDLIQIGTRYGGWVVPSQLLDANSICYCVGCGEDITFDLGLIERFGCDVYGFDPTPRAIKHVNQVAGENPKYHFSEVGLWDEQDTLKFFVPSVASHVSHSLVNLQKTSEFIEVPVKRLSQIMRENGHARLDLLKLDVEGAEYRVVDSIVQDRIEIGIVCIEYDEYFCPLDSDYKVRIRNSMETLIGFGYTLVTAQGNANYTFVKNA